MVCFRDLAVGAGVWGPCCFAANGELLAIVDTNNGRLLLADGDSFSEAALPIPRVLDIDVYDGGITLVGIFSHPVGPSRPKLQDLQFAQVDSADNLVAPPVQRDDLDIVYGGSSRDGNGSFWINVAPLEPRNAPPVWLEDVGEGSLRDRPLSNGSLLSTSFDQDGTATIVHLAPDGTELTRWELTSGSPLQLSEVAVDGPELVAALTEASQVAESGLKHRVVRLTPSTVTLLLSLEAVTEPYVEPSGSFEWGAATDTLVRLLPDRAGVSVVTYDTSQCTTLPMASPETGSRPLGRGWAARGRESMGNNENRSEAKRSHHKGFRRFTRGIALLPH